MKIHATSRQAGGMASFQVRSRQKFCLFAVILGPIRLTIGHQTLSQYSKLQPPELLPKKQRRIVGVEEGGANVFEDFDQKFFSF
jgi:hypothetical protein